MNFFWVVGLQTRFPRIIHGCHIGGIERVVVHRIFFVFGNRISWSRFTERPAKEYRRFFIIPEITEKAVIVYGKIKITAVF